MADVMRWRYGETNPVVAAVAAQTLIEIGDLVWQDGGEAKPASLLPNQGTESANQEQFADRFLGVAMQRSPAGQDRPIRVATTGVFEFDCPPSDFELGDWIGPAGRTDGGLQNQRVKKVTDPKYAIGRCAKRGKGVQSVLVDIRSTIMTGGVEGTTAPPASSSSGQ
ncbi:MAG: hypothetical protein NZ602_14285 [Thermoguttaceae bacterium]|nr:hypothetical protein [Thermoguttaceae bacterium]MDW8039617.1 hypothetical protein [Thermoguttaceae bacterium]